MALDTTLKISLDSRQAEQQIDRLTSKNYGIKLNIDSQPLGRITGQLSEFNKSLDAANARVVAFGASAGAIAILEKSFRALIDSAIEVQKSLKDIQVVMDSSDAAINKFGKSLFDVAKNTGQSFAVVAEAATELSRQGLTMEETLKRTNEALILSRLSGLGAAESVRTLTATVNSFSAQAVTASEVINKFANVDAAFAVSSKDLAEGISRVGASAAQSGVSIDELIALITSAQQVTARGGAVIGNSFKTIFTRLERGKTQDLLESLGVSTKDSEGKLKTSIEMLKDLARVYGTLNSGKQAEVAEKVGGVFQINILKAALGDLGKQYSIYDNALKISASSTDEAIQRNEKLNETYAAQINRLQQSATQLAASAGKQVFGPSMDRILGAGNGILDSLNNVDSSSIGAKLGKGILDGIGQILAGPGLVMIGGVVIKLLGDFSKFASGSVKELLGLNGASKEQAAIQASITKLLEKNPSLLAQINSEAKTQNDQAKILLDFYTKQTAQMELQSKLTSQIAAQLYTGGVRMGSEGVPVKKKAEGYIPEFASEEAQAKMLGAKSPRAMWSSGTIGGQKFIKNSEEDEIVGYGRNGDSAVIPRYSAGYIPNFAGLALTSAGPGLFTVNGPKQGGRGNFTTSPMGAGAILKSYRKDLSADQKSILESEITRKEIQTSSADDLLTIGKGANKKVDLNNLDLSSVDPSISSKFGIFFPNSGGSELPIRQRASEITALNGLPVKGAVVTKLKTAPIFPLNEKESDFDNILEKQFLPPFKYLSEQILNTFKPGSKLSAEPDVNSAFTSSVRGSIFEKAVGAATAKTTEIFKESNESDQDPFDYAPLSNYKFLASKLGVSTAAEAKLSVSAAHNLPAKILAYDSGALSKLKDKIYQKINSEKNIRTAASGYIPNFADALHESIAREIGAGAPADEIYVKKYGQLASENNPDGYGVFNKRDEGSVSREMRAMRKRGYARGYIPNFAEDSSGTGSGGVVSGGATALVDLAFAMSIFKNSSNEARQATLEKSIALKEEKIAQIQSQEAIIKTRQAFIDANKDILNMSNAVMNASRDIGFANQKIQELSKRSFSEKFTDTKISVENSRAYQGASKFLSGKGGTALTFAPIVAGQISELIPQNSQGGRGAAQAVSSIGNIASYAGAGGMLGGPVGAGVGLAAGAILEVPKVIEAFTTKLPELQEKSDKDRNKYNELDARSKNYLNASSAYDEALKSGNSNQQELKKLSQAKQASFQQYSPEEQMRLLKARKQGGSEAEYEEVGNMTRESAEQVSSSDRALKQRTFLEKDKREITFGSEAAKDTAGALISQITSGKTGAQGLEALKNINIKDLISSEDKNENQYARAERFGGVLTKAMGGENISEQDSEFVKNITNKLATGNPEAAAATMQQLAEKILKLREAAFEGAKADEEAAALATQAAEKRKQEMEAIRQNASAIEKQIGLIQQATAAYEQKAEFNMERGQNKRNFSTEMTQTRRSNMEEIVSSITGNTMLGAREQGANKISTINENAANKEADIIDKMKLDVAKGVSKQYMNVYDVDKKKSSGAPTDIQSQGDNIKPLMKNSFSGIESYTDAPRDVRQGYIESVGANEINRQSKTIAGVQGAYEQYVKSDGKQGDQDKFRAALAEHFGKMIDSSQADSQELRNLIAENVQKAEASRQEIVKVRESAKQEQDKANAELQKLTVLMGLQASAKTFGGGMKALESNKTTSTPEIEALITTGTAAQKNKVDKQRLVNSGLALASTDVGDKNIAQNYLKFSRVMREKYQGGLATGENIGSDGPQGAEGLMVQEIQKAMTKDLEATRKSVSKGPEEYKVMNMKSENAMIANATGRKSEDVAKLSGKDRDAAMTEALNNIAKVKVAQETGDRSILKNDKTGVLQQMFEKTPEHQEDLNKYYRDEGNKAEQEAASLLKQIYDQLSAGQKTSDAAKIDTKAESIKNSLATPVDYSKYGDDTEWRKGQEAKEREDERQRRIKNVTQSMQVSGGQGLTGQEKEMLPHLKSGYAGLATARVDKQMAKEDAEKNKKQEQESKNTEKSSGGAGNVSVSAPINVSINVNSNSATGKDTTDLQAQIQSKLPEFQKQVNELAQKTLGIQAQVDRLAMSNQAGKPIPVKYAT
jgi:TP901 family phage tail tape measure protein